MSLAESKGALNKGAKALANRWLDAKGIWKDGRAEHFEKEYLLPLEAEVRKAMAAMDHMDVVLQTIIKDCE